MNEVAKIHLGRQAFTISADAHHELRTYLDAIKKQVGDKEVLNEIELRMAELLLEHGITDTKVILPADVDFLKEQLGNPKDFKEDSEEADSQTAKRPNSKRLFRDTDNAMIAGVASGLSNYFGIDVLLIRILFVVATLITVGWGILVYIVLWLLVPEAKTSSDRLMMAGKSVTVGSLKEIAERADVKGAARRANDTLVGPINKIFSFIVKLIGTCFVAIGVSLMLGLLAVGFYLVFHGNFVMDNLFPIGIKEHVLVYVGFAVAGLISLFVVLIGLAIFRRRWPVRAWLTGVLAGLTLIGFVAGASLAADAAPRVRDRYNANFYVDVRNVPPFTNISTIGQAVAVNVQPANKYYVSLKYYRGGDPSQVKTTVSNGTLLIDYKNYQWDRHCPTFCIPNVYNLTITVYTPNPLPLTNYPTPPGPAVYPDSKPYYQ